MLCLTVSQAVVQMLAGSALTVRHPRPEPPEGPLDGPV